MFSSSCKCVINITNHFQVHQSVHQTMSTKSTEVVFGNAYELRQEVKVGREM